MLVEKCKYMLLSRVKNMVAVEDVNNICEKTQENYSRNPTREVWVLN